MALEPHIELRLSVLVEVVMHLAETHEVALIPAGSPVAALHHVVRL
jgi:hypothetical protein